MVQHHILRQLYRSAILTSSLRHGRELVTRNLTGSFYICVSKQHPSPVAFPTDQCQAIRYRRIHYSSSNMAENKYVFRMSEQNCFIVTFFLILQLGKKFAERVFVTLFYILLQIPHLLNIWIMFINYRHAVIYTKLMQI